MNSLSSSNGIPVVERGVTNASGLAEYTPTAAIPGTGPAGTSCAQCKHFRPLVKEALKEKASLNRVKREDARAEEQGLESLAGTMAVYEPRRGRCLRALALRRFDRDYGVVVKQPGWWRSVAAYDGAGTAGCRYFEGRGET